MSTNRCPCTELDVDDICPTGIRCSCGLETFIHVPADKLDDGSQRKAALAINLVAWPDAPNQNVARELPVPRRGNSGGPGKGMPELQLCANRSTAIHFMIEENAGLDAVVIGAHSVSRIA